MIYSAYSHGRGAQCAGLMRLCDTAPRAVEDLVRGRGEVVMLYAAESKIAMWVKSGTNFSGSQRARVLEIKLVYCPTPRSCRSYLPPVVTRFRPPLGDAAQIFSSFDGYKNWRNARAARFRLCSDLLSVASVRDLLVTATGEK